MARNTDYIARKCLLRDLAILRSPAGRKRYEKFSRRARAAVQSYQGELAAGR